jgi:hypothetical protein
LGLDLDDLDPVIRNGAHLRGHAFAFTILQATVEYRASWLLLLLLQRNSQRHHSERNLVPPMDRRAPQHPAAVFSGFGKVSQECANAALTPESALPPLRPGHDVRAASQRRNVLPDSRSVQPGLTVSSKLSSCGMSTYRRHHSGQESSLRGFLLPTFRRWQRAAEPQDRFS